MRSKSSSSRERGTNSSRVAFPLAPHYGRASIRKSGTDMSDATKRIAALIAAEIAARPEQAAAAIQLLDEGLDGAFHRALPQGGRPAGLTTRQLRNLAERLVYLRELESAPRRDPRLDPLAGQADRGAGGADRRRRRPRRNSKTSICPISPSAAPRPRSPASAASDRWRRRSSPIAAPSRRNSPRHMSSAKSPTMKAALDGARDIIAETIAGQRRARRPAARLSCKEKAFLRARR